MFFGAIIAVVFQQIHTSMTEQQIASGGPYDNAAAYPRIIAILIGIMVAIQASFTFLKRKSSPEDQQAIAFSELKRPAALLIIFALYLGLLGTLGYHLTTTPMILAIMVLCGMRLSISTAAISFSIAIAHAYAFEVFLKVVLPGGIFGLNIPW